MTNAEHSHVYKIGDQVLADMNGVRVPGVVEAEREGELLVRLAEPWSDGTGQTSDETWLTPDRLVPSLAGGEQALPG